MDAVARDEREFEAVAGRREPPSPVASKGQTPGFLALGIAATPGLIGAVGAVGAVLVIELTSEDDEQEQEQEEAPEAPREQPNNPANLFGGGR